MRIWSHLLKKSLTENFIFCELKCLTKGSALTYRRASACNFENFNSLRSRLSEVLVGKSVLKICRKFTEDHPCRSAITIKLQSNFIEIVLQHGCSPVNSLDIFRTPFPTNTSRLLLLQPVRLIAACWLRSQVQKIYLPGDFILEYVMLMIKKCFSWYVVLGSEYASDF